MSSAVHSWKTWSCAGYFAIAACARTGLRTDFDAQPSLQRFSASELDASRHSSSLDGSAEASTGCEKNADCDAESICIEQMCVFFGECLLDWHCGGGQRRCRQNVCEGEFGPSAGGGEPEPCEINNDCAEHDYCVDGACRRGVECLKHAHCEAAYACLGERCLSAF